MTHRRMSWFRVISLSLVLGALCLVARANWSEVTGPSPNDAKVAKIVAEYLKEVHLSKYSLDDDVSRRTWRALISGTKSNMGFDPAKVYFTQQDIEEFRKHEVTIDDEILKGDLSFAYQVLDRYLERMRERLSLVEEFVNAPHDFSVDEYMSTDYDSLDYSANDAEVRERWRKKVKFDLLQLRLDKKPLPEAEQKEKVLRRYKYLVHRWADQTTADEILEMYLNAVTTSFDPHTNYMSPSTLEDFNIQMRLHLDGIGAKLRWEDGYTIVAEILPGGAADQDGRLHVDDKIIGVAADGETIVDVVDMRLQDVVKKIRGKKDTSVALRVIPASKTEAADYKLTRAKIELKNQEARSEIVEDGKKPDGTPYRIGYIQLPSFYYDIAAASNGEENFKSCKEDVKHILQKFLKEEKGVDGVILDLRSNGGGALQEAIDLTGLFIDQGAVVKIKTRSDRVETHNDKDAGTAFSGPLMVIVNKLSASASEILAGAIQDYGRGLVVGDSSTHGKGTVQTVVDLSRPSFGSRGPQLGALKLTIQQFYRVNGDSTQNRGVIPDLVLPAISDHLAISESDLPQAVPFGQVKPSEYASLRLVPAELKKQLITLSEKRRTESTDFGKLADEITRLEELKKRKANALSEERRREEMKRGATNEDALDELENEIDKPKKKDAPLFERNYYNTEVLAIMQDFLRLGGHSTVAKTNKL